MSYKYTEHSKLRPMIVYPNKRIGSLSAHDFKAGKLVKTMATVQYELSGLETAGSKQANKKHKVTA